MGNLGFRNRLRTWFAGWCITAAVALLVRAGKTTPRGHFRECIRQGLRGLWEAGLHSKDIDGGSADRIPKPARGDRPFVNYDAMRS